MVSPMVSPEPLETGPEARPAEMKKVISVGPLIAWDFPRALPALWI
jgi:hypothetical protein